MKQTDSFVHEMELGQACARYLERQGYILWANWDINDRERRELARAWLQAQVSGVILELTDADEAKWRASWQYESLIWQKYSAACSTIVKLRGWLKRTALRAATLTSDLWTATRMSHRSRLRTDSPSEYQRWIDSLAAMDAVSLRSSRDASSAARLN